jgi:hypothetical protein
MHARTTDAGVMHAPIIEAGFCGSDVSREEPEAHLRAGHPEQA